MSRLLILLLILFALVSYLCIPNILKTTQEDSKYTTTPQYTVPTEYSGIPEPYYISVPRQYGVDVLREYLQQMEWERDYVPNVFDCTEMSAFLERELENEGFHTYIAGGQLDNNLHSWVKVEAVPRVYIIVEATTLAVIVPGNAKYNRYHETDRDETIYDAMKICPSAYDWWN